MPRLVLKIGQLDVFIKVVIGACLCKSERRPESYHEGVDLRTAEVCDLFNQCLIETMVNEFVLLISNQSALECSQAAVPVKTKYVDQFVKIQPNAGTRRISKFQSRLFIIKILCVVLPVLQRVHMVVAGCHADCF